MVYLLSQTSQAVEVKLLSTVDYVKNHSLYAWSELQRVQLSHPKTLSQSEQDF